MYVYSDPGVLCEYIVVIQQLSQVQERQYIKTIFFTDWFSLLAVE